MKSPIIINYLVTLFMLCSPLAAIPVFLSLTQGRSRTARKKSALWIGVTVGIILAVTVWIGGALLSILGIRIPAFQCAGGIIVFLLALSMLNAQVSPMRQIEEEEAAKTKAMIPFVPLVIPVMVGPASLSSVIVMGHIYHSFEDLVVLSFCGLVVGALVTLILYFGNELEQKIGATGINVITRIGGLILSALSIEIFVRGIEGIFFS